MEQLSLISYNAAKLITAVSLLQNVKSLLCHQTLTYHCKPRGTTVLLL